MSVKAIIASVTAVICLVFLYGLWPWVTVPARHRGVVTLFGKVQERPLEPGLNFVNPMAHVYDMDVKMQKAVIKGDAASKDLQHVSTQLAFTDTFTRILGKKVAKVFAANLGATFPREDESHAHR